MEDGYDYAGDTIESSASAASVNKETLLAQATPRSEKFNNRSKE